MLNTDEIERFDRDRYLVFPGLLGGAKLQQYLSIFRELVNRAKAVKTDSQPT